MASRRLELVAAAAMLCAVAALFVALQSDARVAGATGASAAPQVAIPSTFNYQGILRNPDGSLVNGTSNITLKIYDLATGGTVLHNETFTAVPVRDGLFNVVLGDATSLPATLFAANAPLFVGVSVGANPELIPRQRVHPVPWALMATTLVAGATVEGVTLDGVTKIDNVSIYHQASDNSLVFNGGSAFNFATNNQYRLYVTGTSTTIGGNAGIEGNATIAGTTTIGGNTTINNSTTMNGTTTVNGKLHVGPNVPGATPKLLHFGDLNASTGQGYVYIGENGEDDRMELRAGAFFFNNGNVGIGTSTPTRGKLDVGGTLPNVPYNIGGFLNRNGAGDVSNTNVTRPVSIWGDSYIVGGEFNAVSDARIKNMQGRSDGAADLATLSRIEITDYTLRDVIANGSAPHKKAIGQQVENVFPQAVKQHTNVVPDIYQQAKVKDGWVSLATTLQTGERVRLIGDENEGIYEVLEVGQDGFRTEFAAAGDAVFVYGREVKDFRVVDYEAIGMLNVSATQELKRRVESQDAEIKTLKAENDALNTRLTALEQRLSALTRPAQGGRP